MATLARKPQHELLAECGEFVHQIERLGVLTHIDDAAYMLALMGNLDPRTYKARTLRKLVLGGAQELNDHVRDINRNAQRGPERPWLPERAQSNAA